MVKPRKPNWLTRQTENQNPINPWEQKGRNGCLSTIRGLGRLEVLGPYRPKPARCPPLNQKENKKVKLMLEK
jgi:hypothetical protein